MKSSIYSAQRYLFETSHACGRYTLVMGQQKLEKRFGTKNKLAKPIKSNYNTSPTQQMPVITNHGEGNEIEIMSWGFRPVWAQDISSAYKFFNARAETLAEKPMWKKSFATKRCLVPASGFYEWRKDGKEKTPYYIHLKDQELFAFAGLYDSWTDKKTGEVHKSYTIITTNPNGLMRPIHDRMPVILDKCKEDDWLNPDANEDIGFLEHLLKPFSAKDMSAYTVSSEVNSAKHNSAELIEPASP